MVTAAPPHAEDAAWGDMENREEAEGYGRGA